MRQAHRVVIYVSVPTRRRRMKRGGGEVVQTPLASLELLEADIWKLKIAGQCCGAENATCSAGRHKCRRVLCGSSCSSLMVGENFQVLKAKNNKTNAGTAAVLTKRDKDGRESTARHSTAQNGTAHRQTTQRTKYTATHADEVTDKQVYSCQRCAGRRGRGEKSRRGDRTNDKRRRQRQHGQQQQKEQQPYQQQH